MKLTQRTLVDAGDITADCVVHVVIDPNVSPQSFKANLQQLAQWMALNLNGGKIRPNGGVYIKGEGSTDLTFMTDADVPFVIMSTSKLRLVSGVNFQLGNDAQSGTITPDKTVIIYDSTGTAYKVPVQAV